jgi:hypothetical protein
MKPRMLTTVGIFVLFGSVYSGVLANPFPLSALPTLIQQVDVGPWEVLRSFENQDLRELDDASKSRLQNSINALISEGNYDRFGQLYGPHLFTKILTSKQQSRYVLIEASASLGRPSHPALRVSVFNLQGKLLTSSAFDGGSRIVITTVSVSKVAKLSGEVIVVSTRSDLWSGKRTQLYSLVDDRVRLIGRKPG